MTKLWEIIEITLPFVGAAVAFLLLMLCSAEAKDATAGRAVFQSQCSVCHSPVSGKNAVGPSLFGVVGRHTASVPGFHYSPANQAANLVWSEGELDKYIDAPRTIVPGTTMTFGGVHDAGKRGDLVAYLATLR